MHIPFLDVSASNAELEADIDAAYHRVMKSGQYVLGPEMEAFEAEFAAYCGGGHCVAVGTGCDALELILRANDIGPGAEVIVPAHTFIATWLAVSSVGARPVPVEPAEDTYTLDPDRIEAAITPRTRAIIPVHLYGHPAAMRAIEDVATRHGLLVIQDAAQAPGARCHGQRLGSGCSPVAFSFYPGKNLGAVGDGGAVVTSDAALADRIRMLRNYGSRVKYEHEVRGTNSRLDELQAAILRVKLTRLDAWNTRRAAIAGRYLSELAGIDDVLLPRVASWASPVWHLFVIRSKRRAELHRRLAAAGVETLVHYPVPVHRSNAYAATDWPIGSFPLTERLSHEVLSLPIGPHLSEQAVTAVVSAVVEATDDKESP
ncbi:dTDP-3-amino-3, 4, 6-trideoxy-alpha-D-glucose transaminase [Amycolatopsis marina]|uniref:dTDP-3-amino-3, 4, 6-trideoxy-alpha-D-glucose transaminase n=1 Tax=Amycolatopsis marina TaxID=490629 RepID=A0A1I0ZNB0_9PSEU|nr:DegT/DnrJ/EryC1/StrS family aminotransferase [Amycolatopsis marina]SFB25878.1 dTDP-3-amino-3, 4, 6-trideoxy-alpha-D-glucose transaminase [Amycolatopsis marina]